MATEVVNTPGVLSWEVDRDDDGYRTYMLKTRVKAGVDDGPALVLQTAGLPSVGSYWLFKNDIDIWAWCTPYARVRPVKTAEPNKFWDVEQKFSTRPGWRCQAAPVEDPLLEPPRIGGSFVKYMEEAVFDRFGKMITNSSKELYRGHQVEFDAFKATVWIEVNDSGHGLPVITQLLNVVNDVPMWGVGRRCVKFSGCVWERKVQGVCSFYYTRHMDFDIDSKTHDRDLLDYGTKVLRGKWDTSGGVWVPDPGANWLDPSNFQTAVDFHGNPVPSILLDGGGQPLTGGAPMVKNKVEKYLEDNLFLLGIPATF